MKLNIYKPVGGETKAKQIGQEFANQRESITHRARIASGTRVFSHMFISV